MQPKHDYPVHRAKDLFSAVRLANKLKQSGEFDIFRGQMKNYPLVPTIFRSGVDPNVASRRLSDFHRWIIDTPELSSLHNNNDSVLAVAQHYGIPTPLLDFTYDPTVAGFFASHGSKPIGSRRMTSCIVCANSRTLADSWRELNDRHRNDQGTELVRLVALDIRNLWRLQAQRGLFIDVRVDEALLEMFSFFLHIEFPWSPSRTIGDESEIYPKNKSHLEILLDQYFLIETYPDREQRMLEIFGHKIDVYPKKFLGYPNYFIGDKFPPRHESWSTSEALEWLSEPEDQWPHAQSSHVVTLSIDTTETSFEYWNGLEKELEDRFQHEGLRLNSRVDWRIEDEKGIEIRAEDALSEPDEEDNLSTFHIGEIVSLMFDGMRGKPYTNQNLARAIIRYIRLCVQDGWDVMKLMFRQVLGTEWSGGSTRGRGFCDGVRVLDALRDDFFDYLKHERVEEIKSRGADGVLGVLIDPSRLFVFEKFRDLFAEEAMPTQAELLIEGRVLVMNAARVDVFGLS